MHNKILLTLGCVLGLIACEAPDERIDGSESNLDQSSTCSAPSICNGTRVVSPGGEVGTVIGVNRSKGTAVVDLDNYTDHSIFEVEELFIATKNQCTDGHCTGTRVVSPGAELGTVIGVNPNTHKVAVDLDDYTDHSIVEAAKLYFGSNRCVSGVCTGKDGGSGDRVLSPGGEIGVVIGVNPITKRVAVDLDNYTDHSTYAIKDIFVQNECVGYADHERAAP